MTCTSSFIPSIAILALAAVPQGSLSSTGADASPSASSRPVPFVDCRIGCPEMVTLPTGEYRRGGSYISGDPPPPDQHQSEVVKLRRPIAIGRFDVTVSQYAAFMTETKRKIARGCATLRGNQWRVADQTASWSDPGFHQTGNDPVVCVNLDDAMLYAAWLSRKTGKHYRLPLEWEWEFAARARSTGPFYWSTYSENICSLANSADLSLKSLHVEGRGADCDDGFPFTSPVGHYPPNEYGLYDMAGNVAQWTSSCSDVGCRFRLTRGGSWLTDASELSVSHSAGIEVTSRSSDIGFRLVRE